MSEEWSDDRWNIEVKRFPQIRITFSYIGSNVSCLRARVWIDFSSKLGSSESWIVRQLTSNRIALCADVPLIECLNDPDFGTFCKLLDAQKLDLHEVVPSCYTAFIVMWRKYRHPPNSIPRIFLSLNTRKCFLSSTVGEILQRLDKGRENRYELKYPQI